MAVDRVALLRSRVDYDAGTGIFTWLPDPTNKNPRWNQRYAGTRAFATVGGTGYYISSVGGKKMYAQTAAWLHYHGREPYGRIRILNGDKSDVRIANLSEEGQLPLEERQRLYQGTARAARYAVPPEQIKWLEEHNHLPVRKRFEAFNAVFNSDRTFWSFKYLCQKHGVATSLETISRLTEKRLRHPDGTRKLHVDGFYMIRTKDGWRAEHRLNWIAKNGPIPPKHVLMCVSGDRSDTRPENWRAVTKGVVREASMGYRLRIGDVPAEAREAVIDLAQLSTAIRKKSRRSGARPPA